MSVWSQGSPVVALGLEKLGDWADELLAGLAMTLYLYFVALTIGFLLGVGLALGRQYGGPVLSRIVTGYIEVVRGTPLLAQIFLIYVFPYSLNAWLTPDGPPFFMDIRWAIEIGGIRVLSHPILSSILALGLNSAAYQAEYIRGAIASIGEGQMLAARALGLSQMEGIRHVILPQAFRRMIPSWSNEASYLPKYTVVATFITVEDFFGMAKRAIAATFLSLETWLIVAAVYLVLITVISRVLERVYQKTKIPGL